VSVLSVSVPVERYAMLTNVALKFGVQCDLVDADEDTRTVYADLHADTRRAIQVSLRAGATRLAIVDNIEHGEIIKSRPVKV
jgi:UDP-N-acetylmuramyl pentapeptide synthase